VSPPGVLYYRTYPIWRQPNLLGEDRHGTGVPSVRPPPLAGAAGFYASFWRRVGAAFVDGCIVALPLAALTWSLDDQLGSVISTLATIAYQGAFLVTRGATPGRRLLGIRVIDATGANPDLSKALIRQIFSILGLVLVIFTDHPFNPIGFVLIVVSLADVLWMLRDERYQTLHDRLAGTFVVRASAMTPSP